MTSLKSWYFKRLVFPLLGLSLLIVLVVSATLINETQKRKNDLLNLISKTSSLLNLAFDQRNNALIETALANLLIQSKAEAIAICEDRIELLSIGGSEICQKSSRNVLVSYEVFPVQAAFGKSVILKNNILKIYQDIILLVFLTMVLFFSIAVISRYTLRRFSDEILSPMTDGLNSTSVLAIQEFESIRRQNLVMHRFEKEKAVLEAVLEKNAQVAHDIRSPLTALNMVVKIGLNAGQGVEELLKKSIVRINEIADDLKNQNAVLMSDQKDRFVEKNAFDLMKVIDQLVEEKRIEFQECQNLKVKIDAKLSEISVFGTKSDLTRVLSNIINNAKEAVEQSPSGQISISVKRKEHFVEILIQDNGPGFPEKILTQVGVRGITFNKKLGSGLGLYHAVKIIKQMAGEVAVANIEQGGQVAIRLPIYDGKSV